MRQPKPEAGFAAVGRGPRMDDPATVRGKTASMTLMRHDGQGIGVLIIDDHPLLTQGCARLLERTRLANVVEAAGPSDGFRKYRTHRPDIIIIDIAFRSSAFGGLSFIRRLRAYDSRTPILALSAYSDPAVIRRMIEAGATGYVQKHDSADELLKAFDRVSRGKPYLSYDIACELSFNEAGKANPLRSLSVRELQVLSLIADGKPYSSIADEMGVSYKTVANTAAHIRNKLGARTLPELMRIAIEQLPRAVG